MWGYSVFYCDSPGHLSIIHVSLLFFGVIITIKRVDDAQTEYSRLKNRSHSHCLVSIFAFIVVNTVTRIPIVIIYKYEQNSNKIKSEKMVCLC